MNFFYLLKESFNNLLFDSLNIGMDCQVARCHKDGHSEECARTYYEALNQTLLTQKYRGSSPNAFCGQEAYDTY